MPLITLTIKKGKPAQFIDAVLDAVHAALIASGVPKEDKFQRVLELDAEHFRYDAQYPDVATARNNDFVLIEIMLSVGRSVKIKKQIVASIISHIQTNLNLDPENVMIVFLETRWENWSFAGGRFIHV